jgi:3,4-dihydroxy 2-butanone 4-phosphate synthase/GTP cyclohydrolase II
VAFVYGDIGDGRAVPTRLHRANLILDVFGGAKAVRKTLERFKAEGRGVLVMLRDGAAGVPVVRIPKSDETASGEARSRQWREVGWVPNDECLESKEKFLEQRKIRMFPPRVWHDSVNV